MGGTPTQCANVPCVPNGSGTPAHVVESTEYAVCRRIDVPPVLRIPSRCAATPSEDFEATCF
jgi:hypothetical protein